MQTRKHGGGYLVPCKWWILVASRRTLYIPEHRHTLYILQNTLAAALSTPHEHIHATRRQQSMFHNRTLLAGCWCDTKRLHEPPTHVADWRLPLTPCRCCISNNVYSTFVENEQINQSDTAARRLHQTASNNSTTA